MAWTTPGTAVTNSGLTAAFWNTNVRDNLNAIYTAGTNVVMGTDSTATTIASTTLTDTGLSVSITPTSATSKVLVWAWVPMQSFRETDANNSGLALLRGSTVIGSTTGEHIGSTGGTISGLTAVRGVWSIVYLDSPATSSAVTYKIQGKVNTTANAANMVAQFVNQQSNIVCMEILV
jgi:hypothetical protein